jgi:hypothetical protein
MCPKVTIFENDFISKQVEDNCIINKKGRVLIEKNLTTVNNLKGGRLNKKELQIDFSRPENFLNHKQILMQNLLAENSEKKSWDKNLHTKLHILRQVDSMAPYMPEKCETSRRDVFSIYVQNRINRSLEFQSEFIKKAHMDVANVNNYYL